MGNIKKILSETIIGNSGLYDDHARLEIQEAVHFHYRDGRYILNKNDFISLCELFNEAYKKYVEIGMPENTKDMVTLANKSLGNSIHSNRIGSELDITSTIHIHYRDLRIHLTKPDYHALFQHIFTGNILLNLTQFEYVNLTDKKIRLHPVVNQYINDLKKYDNNEYEKEDADSVIYYSMIVRECEMMSEPNKKIERGNGFPLNYPKQIPKDIDRKYLFSIYESMKKYGYAEGPFFGQYIIIYKEKPDTLYVKDSHRVACLLHLELTKIRVLVTEPESGWKP